MRYVWALILAAATAPAWTAPTAPVSPALATLEACAAGLDSLDIGYERIAERCPTLTAALEDSGYAPWLPADWKRPGNELSAAGLAQLHVLLQRELAPRPLTHVPDVSHLAPVLADLPPVEPSWVARLSAWLRTPAAPHPAQGSAAAGWLEPVAPLPAAAGYGLLGLLVLGAALLAVRELRLLAVRWPHVAWPLAVSRRRVPAAGEGGDEPRQQSSDPRQKLGVLLAAVAARLAAQGRLSGSRGLTAREIRQATLPPELLPQLSTLTGVSEQLAYAPVAPSEADIEAAARQGRELLAQLEADS